MREATTITWIQSEEWGRHYDNIYAAYYRPNRIDFFEQEIIADISLCELQNILPVLPASNPTDMTEPGPCERWYGRVKELLFWVTYYYTPRENYTDIICIAPPSQGKYRWSFLEQLIDLPSPILRRISWIRGHKRASKSIYFRDKTDRACEVYRSKTSLEATELLSFLLALKSEYNYYIDEPE
jgi:hypothetical protein